MTAWTYRFSDPIPVTEEGVQLGLKALSIWRLAHGGYSPLRGVILRPDLFSAFVQSSQALCAAHKAVTVASVNKVNLLQAADSLHQIFLETPCPAWIAETILRTVEEAKLGFPLAVRSSAYLEDRPDQPMAGMYETVLDVCRENLVESVKKCWASLYGRRSVLGLVSVETELTSAMHNLGRNLMTVVIQEMAASRSGGVLLTWDPISDYDDILVIEAAQTPLQVVQGGTATSQYYIKKSSPLTILQQKENTDGVTQEELEALRKIAQALEQDFGGPLEVEWAITPAGEIIVLQYRKLLRPTEDAIPTTDLQFHFVATEDADGLDIDYGSCRGIHHAYQKKKFPMRLFARQHGIRIPQWYWLRYDAQSLKQWAQEHDWRADFVSPLVWVDLSSNLRGILVPKVDLIGFLLDLVLHSPTTWLTVLLRDPFDTEVAAISCVTAERQVLIEYALGALQGIRSGRVETSTKTVAPSGTSDQKKPQTLIAVVDHSLRKIVYRTISPRLPEIPPAALAEVVHGTQLLGERFAGALAEWWIWNHHAYLFDMSFEQDDYQQVLSHPHVLSSGHATGRAFVVRDLSVLEDIEDGWAISVGRVSQDVASLYDIEQLRNELIAMRANGQGVILVAPKPHVGLTTFLLTVRSFLAQKAKMG